MTTPIVLQAAGRGFMPGILTGLMGTAGITYGPQLFKKDELDVSQLTAALAALRPQPGVTVVANPAGGSGKMMSATVAIACLTGTGLLAMKLAGFSLSSMLWVTRQHFRKGMSTLEKGMETLSKRITEVRVGLLSKIEQVAGKQDKLAASQAEIRNDLGSLSIKVGQVEGGINCVKGVVDAVAQKIDSVEVKVDESWSMLQVSHRGLLLLCRILCNTIEKRETSREEARMLREFAEQRGIEPGKPSAFLPQVNAALEDRRDYFREMIAPKQSIPVAGFGCATDFTKGWKKA